MARLRTVISLELNTTQIVFQRKRLFLKVIQLLQGSNPILL